MSSAHGLDRKVPSSFLESCLKSRHSESRGFLTTKMKTSKCWGLNALSSGYFPLCLQLQGVMPMVGWSWVGVWATSRACGVATLKGTTGHWCWVRAQDGNRSWASVQSRWGTGQGPCSPHAVLVLGHLGLGSQCHFADPTPRMGQSQWKSSQTWEDHTDWPWFSIFLSLKEPQRRILFESKLTLLRALV
jgi:hypothetical protein